MLSNAEESSSYMKRVPKHGLMSPAGTGMRAEREHSAYVQSGSIVKFTAVKLTPLLGWPDELFLARLALIQLRLSHPVHIETKNQHACESDAHDRDSAGK